MISKLHFTDGNHNPTACVKCGVALKGNGNGPLWTFNSATYANPPDDFVACDGTPEEKSLVPVRRANLSR